MIMSSTSPSVPGAAAVLAASDGRLTEHGAGIVALGHTFDFRNPDYAAVWKARVARLAKLRDPETGPQYLAACKLFYKTNIPQFIDDWGVTVDPRNAGSGRPLLMPFVLFPKQREFLEFIADRQKASHHGNGDGILVKSRDCGASWLAMAYSITLCLFHESITVGFGSAKEDKVDRSGDPNCLFYKGRQFLRYLPAEFRGSWNPKKHTAHMRIELPDTEGAITGEAGDNMGVGGRATLYFVDEAALVERPQLVDVALSNVTRCRIEMSSVRGIDNVFAQRARGGKIPRFDFHYRYDPRKVNTTGRDQIVEYKGVPVIVPVGAKYPDFEEFYNTRDELVQKQEFECDFLASISGGVIEAVWIQAAIGAAQKLGVVPTGEWLASFDIADLGSDKNAVNIRHGIECVYVEEWSGNNSNPMESIRRAFEIADKYGARRMKYDAAGMGGTWHEYFNLVNEERIKRGAKPIVLEAFNGGAAVLDPESTAPGTDRTNLDYFENLKAQCWMALRMRFMETFKALRGEAFDREGIISISPEIKNVDGLIAELAQPTRKWSKNAKLMIDKTPDGVASPNKADSVMQNFGYSRPPLVFNDEFFAELAGHGGG